MGKKHFKAEQIIRMLREADVEVAKGQSLSLLGIFVVGKSLVVLCKAFRTGQSLFRTG